MKFECIIIIVIINSTMWFNLQGVEKGLVEQINYLTEVATGQPHEGSIYGAEKVRLGTICVCK